jgi:surface antigen
LFGCNLPACLFERRASIMRHSTQTFFSRELSVALVTALIAAPSLAYADGRRGDGHRGTHSWNGQTQINSYQRNGGDRHWNSNRHNDNGYRRGTRNWNSNTHNGRRFVSGWLGNGWANSGNYNSGWNTRNSGYGYGGYGSGWNSYGSYGYNSDYYRNGRRSKTDTVVLGVGLGVLGLAVAAAASGKSKNNRDRGEQSQSWTDPDGQYRSAQGYPEPAYDASLPAATSNGPDCLQTREYQTTIIVGGKREAAYGTACLQPDGSWRQGPPILEPR